MGLVFNHLDQKDRRRELRQRQTLAEKLVWNSLRAGQLGVCFRRQFSVERYILDFYCPRRRFAVEIDGASHLSLKARKHDLERTEFLNHLGIFVIRFTNIQVFEHLDWVIEQIKYEVYKYPDIYLGTVRETSPMPSPWKGEG
jgi:very-short-patch-repair endonuclease